MSDTGDTTTKTRLTAVERAKAKAAELRLGPRIAEVLAAQESLADARAIEAERLDALDFKLARLEDGGLNPAEIAHVTGMVENTVRSALERWRER